MHEIRYSAEFNKDYVKLGERADRGEGEAKYLIEIISKATAKLAENTEAGRKIPRRLWPKEYIQKYDVKNLWKLRAYPNRLVDLHVIIPQTKCSMAM